MKIKKIFLSIFLLLIFTYTYGQDKIITVQNDTITCYITYISLTHISFKTSNNINAETIFIPMAEVREYSLSSQRKSENSSSVVTPNRSEVRPGNRLQSKPQNRPQNRQKNQKGLSDKEKSIDHISKFRIGVQGGASYIISTLANSRDQMKELVLPQSSQVNDYYHKLRLGIHFASDVHYFFSESFGAGVRYSLFASSTQASFNTQSIIQNGIPTYYATDKIDKIYMNYVGPSFVARQWLNKSHKFRINEELSFGYLNFRQEERFDIGQYAMVHPDLKRAVYGSLGVGNTYGANLQLSFEYYPVPMLSFGLNAGFFAAPLKSLEVTDGKTTVTKTIDKNYHYNMTHYNASIGIRLHL